MSVSSAGVAAVETGANGARFQNNEELCTNVHSIAEKLKEKLTVAELKSVVQDLVTAIASITQFAVFVSQQYEDVKSEQLKQRRDITENQKEITVLKKEIEELRSAQLK